MPGAKRMEAGRLDRRVTIRRPGTVNDSHGEAVATDDARAPLTVWASMYPQRGGERFQSGERAATAVTLFAFRYRDDLVRVTDVIEAEGRTYDVTNWSEIGFREGIEAEAVARGETA